MAHAISLARAALAPAILWSALQGSGRLACLSRASTTGRPIVRLGTKWLSMTSTCSQSAAAATVAASSASLAKSEARMLGEICMLITGRV